MLSKRSERYLTPSMSYIPTFIKFMNNQYNVDSNPSGDLALCVAENCLVSDILLEKIKSFNDYSLSVLNYTSCTGMPRLKSIMSKFLSEKLFCIDNIVDENNIVISSGCCALLHLLSILLFDANEGILIQTPYYPAFDHDFWDLGDVICKEVNIDRSKRKHPFELEEEHLFDEDSWNHAYIESMNNGCKIKAILITNPSNPLGVIYKQDQLLKLIEWARNKSLHIIVDEIYGLSIFDDNNKFTSIVNLLNNNLKDDVHILWSFSKDLGSSGLRLGSLYTQNKILLKSLDSANDSFMVSNLMQELAIGILSDTIWIENYLKELKIRLKRSHDTLKIALEEMNLTVVNASASIFVFVDFSILLKEQTYDEEKKLHQELVEVGLLFTPGKACHCQYPGYFRICYAWVPYISLLEAIRRLRIFVDKKKNNN